MIELLLENLFGHLWVLLRAVIGLTEAVIGPSNCSVHAEDNLFASIRREGSRRTEAGSLGEQCGQVENSRL
jgi:hypothetical protein